MKTLVRLTAATQLIKLDVKCHTHPVSAGLRPSAPTHNPIAKLRAMAKHHPKVSRYIYLDFSDEGCTVKLTVCFL